MVFDPLLDRDQDNRMGCEECWAQTAGIETMKTKSLTEKMGNKPSTANGVCCPCHPSTKSYRLWSVVRKNAWTFCRTERSVPLGTSGNCAMPMES